MMMRVVRLFSAAGLALAAVACSNSTPSQPSSNSGTTASVTAPRPAQPATNSTVRFADQPVTLMVQNAASTASGALYSFEVATDANFSSKVQTKDNVAEVSGGQTSVRLDALAGGRDYYWHARATGGGTTGPFSATYKFTMGPAVTINPPVPIGPLSGAFTSPRPTLRVTNATRTGPAGAITYVFEVATTSAFTTIVMTGTTREGVNETGFTATADLPVNQTLFWRATASDASSGASSAPSAIQSFTTRVLTQAELIAQQLGQTLWPGAVPPGTPGHATMGNDIAFGAGWAIQTLHYAPANVNFPSPDIEMLRLFDLLDRGFDPEGAIGFMKSNGYPTVAFWYPPPEKAVIGLKYVYIAARGKIVANGIWDIVVRVE
jgi:hypothetical protein